VLEQSSFQSVDVSNWEVASDETSGVGEKVWLREPDQEPEQRWLFKPNPEGEGLGCREDWPEKVVAHLGEMLGIPCARVEMAERRERQGIISANLRPQTYELHHGRAYMQVLGVPGYVPGAQGRPGHTLENILLVLDGGLVPPGCELPFEASAFDVFAGYLMLDAWVANRDRHDENWAILWPRTDDEPLRLCGAYDQANSLGYNVPEETRLRLLEEDRVRAWCENGTAYRFEYVPGRKAPTLVDLADRALRLASPAARAYWTGQLDAFDEDAWRRVVDRTPRMSDLARRFALTVLDVNRRRVLDACM
jgi:hypothetical protein